MSRNVIGTILGPKGCGKSTLVREIVREQARVVVLDYVGEYGRDLACDPCWGFADCVEALRWASHSGTFRLSLRDLYDQDRLDVLELLFELTEHLLVIEEAHTLCSPSDLPGPLKRLVAIGRHRRISQLYVTQRPSMVNRLVTSQSDWLVAFHQEEPRDVQYLVARFGVEFERVRELPPYEFILGGDARQAPRAVRARLRGSGSGAPHVKVVAGAPSAVRALKSSGRDAQRAADS